MSDLISRSELLKYMENTELSQYIDEINNGNDNYNSTPLYDYVKEMPTAYSVDKVVEELESEKRYGSKYDSYYEENLYRGEMFENDVNNKTIDKAIEIVKQGGGVDDNTAI